jgi:hypothetical protein
MTKSLESIGFKNGDLIVVVHKPHQHDVPVSLPGHVSDSVLLLNERNAMRHCEELC